MTTPNITQRRLLSQHLIGPKWESPQDVVEWLVAVQAQDYFGAKWALGLRMQATADHGIERAFTEGAILRTHLLRPTWHFVTPADIRWLLALTGPRVHAVNAHMYRKLELDSTIFRRSEAALRKVLEGGRHRTRDELRDALQRAGIAIEGAQRMSYLMMHAELEGLVCSGPRRAKQFTYALLDERAQSGKTFQREGALVELARRYFLSRGPATVQDFAKWSGLTVTEARKGLEGAKPELAQETVDDKTYWFSPSTATGSHATSSTVHLLSIYDEYVSGYKDHGAISNAQTSARLAAMGNALTHIVVADGQVAGTWTRTIRTDAVLIKMDLFGQMTKAQARALNAAIRQYGDFMGMKAVLE